MSQLQIHKEIDSFLDAGTINAVISVGQDLIGKNEDARWYFYFKASEEWISWFWKNGFLDVIKETAKHPEWQAYRIPELDYIVRMTKKDPKMITDILFSIKVFNSGIIEQFFRICSELPAEELKRMIPKMYEEQWVSHMKNYSHYGFEFKQMFDMLATVNDEESSLILSRALLLVRAKQKKRRG